MKFLTTARIAKRYGIQAQTVRRWCQRGLFPNVITGQKTGRGAVYLIPESDLEGFMPPLRGRPPAAAFDESAAGGQCRPNERRVARATQRDPDRDDRD